MSIAWEHHQPMSEMEIRSILLERWYHRVDWWTLVTWAVGLGSSLLFWYELLK